MKLDTAYQQDWYDIVERVCSQRRRKERCDRDLMLAKQSKGSSTGSHSVELPERPPNIYTLCSASTSKSVTHHEQSTPESTTAYAQVVSSPSLEADKLSPEEEVPKLKDGSDGSMLEQSTTAYAQVSSSPSLEVDKLSPEEEILRLKNGSDGLTLEATELRQHGQVSHEVFQEPQTLESANLLPHTFPAENGAQLKEPLQDDLWVLLDGVPFETSAEIELPDTESELAEPFYWYLESGELGAQPKEPLQDHVWDDSFETPNALSARETTFSMDLVLTSRPALHSGRGKPLSLPKPPPALLAIRKRDGHGGGGVSMYGGGGVDGMSMYAGG